MHDLNLTFIGSGNAFSPAGLCCNGFLVNDRVLFDAPPQSLSSLNTVGAEINEIEAVVISHHHGDHFLGLPFLLLHWKWKGRTRPVQIVGPRDTEILGKDIVEKVFPGSLRDIGYELEWIDAKPGSPLVLREGFEIEPYPMTHDHELSACLGYKTRVGRATFAYTGDTVMCDSVMDLAKGVDLMISECASRADVIPVHMNLVDDMPVVREALTASSPLILTHIAPGVNTNGMLNTYVAEDFKRFSF